MLTLLLLVVATTTDATASAWPGFLGPAPPLTVEQLPLRWSPGNSAWVTDLDGYGQSSPVIWNDALYVTSISGSNKERVHVMAFDLATGAKRWQVDFDSASPGSNTVMNSRAAPTPVVDEAGLICFFEQGNMIALDHQGQVRWQRDLVKEFGPMTAEFGLAASVAQLADRVFVLVARDPKTEAETEPAITPYLMALAKKDGSTLWRTDLEKGGGWSSPVILPIKDGPPHLIVSVPGVLFGFDTQAGNELWRITELSGNTSPTPAVVGPGQLIVGAAGGRDGGPSAEAARTNGLVQVTQDSDGKWKAEYLWHSEKALAGFSSPVVAGEYVYLIGRGGVLSCLSLRDGQQLYSERLPCGETWATAMPVGDRLYVHGKGGSTNVVKVGPEYELLAENQLWDDSDPPPSPKDIVPFRGGGFGGGGRGGPPGAGGGQGGGPPPGGPPRGGPGGGGPGGGPRGGGGGGGGFFGGPTLYAGAAVPGVLVLRAGTRLYCLHP